MRSGRTALELAAILGISSGVFSKMIHSETMPVRHHQALRLAGVPEDCLPTPMDLPRGPKPKIPHFPGLAGGTHAQPN